MISVAPILERHGIKPTMHRLAVAKFILGNRAHPSAEEVWGLVKAAFPAVSRATVYNVLDLFVQKGLLRRRVIRGSHAVYDPVTERHHHLVEERTGRIYDIPWQAVRLPARLNIPGFEIEDFHLVIKGKKKK